MNFDASELQALGADLMKAGAVAAATVRPIAQKAGVKMKADWRTSWSGMVHAPLLPAAITFDTKATAGGVEVEVGPDKDRPQGALGNLIEFGSVNNAPRTAGPAVLAREADAVEKLLGDAAERIL